MDPNKLGYAHEIILKKYLPDIANLEIRHDDVFVISYPKGGTTWTLHIVCQILKEDRNNTDKSIFEEIPYLEFPQEHDLAAIDTIPGQYELLDIMSSPRVIKSHLKPHNLPRDMKVKAPKVIYVARNPKDTAVSAYNFFKLLPGLPTLEEWPDFFEHLCNGTSPRGSWFEHVLTYWKQSRNDPNMLFLKFENMIKDLKGAVSTISEFLERSLSEESLDLIVNNSTFSAMKSNPKTNPDQNPIFSGELNKTPAQFLRKGKVGDWKNYFTVAQNESFDVLYTEKLHGSDLTFEFEPSHL